MRQRMRAPLALSLALATGLTGVAASAAVAGPPARQAQTAELTVLATTDIHGRVQNWDYFADKPYSDKYGNTVGLANASSAIDDVRAERGEEAVVVVDNGDFLQGTPLTTYYAKQAPITETGEMHPMAAAYNAVGYDVQNLGNHEFNYGLDLLATYEDQVDFPLLAANVVDAQTGEPAFQPYEIITRKVTNNKPVKIGFVGLTTPGSMVWDKANLEGHVEIEDMVESAKKWVPRVRAAGADVVVVLSHAGQGQSSYDAPGLGDENPSDDIARLVPGIDAMVLGHSHQFVEEQFIQNEVSGEDVLIVQPRNWAQTVADITFDLEKVKGKWQVTEANGAVLNSADYPADPEVIAATQAAHDTTVEYVNTVIATSTDELSAATSRYEDTAILDYIQMVQAETVKEALAGTQYSELSVLSIAAPFSRTAVFPQGDVTIRDMAGLYIYDNTLEGRLLTGAQVKDYLEYSAKYFAQMQPGQAFDPETMTQVEWNGAPVWDYNYDVMSGIDYDINLAKPVGERIENLTLNGEPVDDDQQFVVAINNYRASGGGAFPHVASAPVVYNDMAEIRQLLIDWAMENEVIDPADFFVDNWRLTFDGEPVA